MYTGAACTCRGGRANGVVLEEDALVGGAVVAGWAWTLIGGDAGVGCCVVAWWCAGVVALLLWSLGSGGGDLLAAGPVSGCVDCDWSEGCAAVVGLGVGTADGSRCAGKWYCV